MTEETRPPEGGDQPDPPVERSASEEAVQPPKSKRQLELEATLQRHRERAREAQAALRKHKAMVRSRADRSARKAATKDKILLGAYLMHKVGGCLERMPRAERAKLAAWLSPRDREHLHERGFPVPPPKPPPPETEDPKTP